MQNRVYYRVRMPRNPLLQILTLVVVAVVAIGAVLLGAIILSLFLGLALIAGLVLYARLWWLRRRLRSRESGAVRRPSEFIDAEYTLLEERPVSDERSRGPED